MIITQDLTNMANKFLKECFFKAMTILINPVLSDLVMSCSTLEQTLSMINIHQCLSTKKKCLIPYLTETLPFFRLGLLITLSLNYLAGLLLIFNFPKLFYTIFIDKQKKDS